MVLGEFAALWPSIKGVVDLLSKAYRFADEKHLSDEEFFSNLVDPLYIKLEAVVDDYIRLFNTTINELTVARKPSEISAVLRNLEENRGNMMVAGAVVREKADALRDVAHNKEISRFLEKIERVFFSANPYPPSETKPKVSRASKAIALLEMLELREVKKGEVLQSIKDARKQIEKAWYGVVQSHAKLEFKYKYSLRQKSA